MGRIVSALLAVLAVSFATALVLSVPPAVPSATAKSAPRSSQTGGSPEAKLSAVFEEIGRQRFDTALDEVDKLLAEQTAGAAKLKETAARLAAERAQLDKDRAAALKSAKVTLPSSLTVTVY